MSKQGVLIINLGTPDSTSVSDVRKYLGEFLMDPRVLDINPIGRALLVHGIILRTRPKKSAEAYQKIWFKEGSPLLIYGEALRDKMQAKLDTLGHNIPVKLAMRYQNPSIKKALEEFKEEEVDDLIVFPLFPQYSSAATGSAIEKVFSLMNKEWNFPSVQVISDYYDHPGFIKPWIAKTKKMMSEINADKVLMSFHGLPRRHCEKSDLSGNHCYKKENCCDSIEKANRYCYSAQCFATARAIAKDLELGKDQYDVAFQSRLGRAEWIKPYADKLIKQYPSQGTKNLLVICPAFTADCLETLEEVEMGFKEDFEEAGGDQFALVPSLNADDEWVDGIHEILKSRLH